MTEEIAIVGTDLQFIDGLGNKWSYTGTLTGNGGLDPRQIRIDAGNFYYVDANGDERVAPVSTEVVGTANEARSVAIESSLIKFIDDAGDKKQVFDDFNDHSDTAHSDHQDHDDSAFTDHSDHDDAGSFANFTDHDDSGFFDDFTDHSNFSDHTNHNDGLFNDFSDHTNHNDHDDNTHQNHSDHNDSSHSDHQDHNDVAFQNHSDHNDTAFVDHSDHDDQPTAA